MLLKELLKKFCYSGFFKRTMTSGPIMNRLVGNSLVVFLFHDVSDSPSEFSIDNGLCTPTDVFEAQIRLIAENFKLLTPEQLLASSTESHPSAFITFDDGTKSYFEIAAPIMERYECPSTVFLNMGVVHGEIFWSGLISYLAKRVPEFVKYCEEKNIEVRGSEFVKLSPTVVQDYFSMRDTRISMDDVKEYYGGFATEEHLREAAKSEYIYFGNHLFNHHNSTTLSTEELGVSFLKNQNAIESYPNGTKLFSYPFGQPISCYNENTNTQILSLGAKKIFSALPMNNSDNSASVLYRISGIPNSTILSEISFPIVFGALKQRMPRSVIFKT